MHQLKHIELWRRRLHQAKLVPRTNWNCLTLLSNNLTNGSSQFSMLCNIQLRMRKWMKRNMISHGFHLTAELMQLRCKLSLNYMPDICTVFLSIKIWLNVRRWFFLLYTLTEVILLCLHLPIYTVSQWQIQYKYKFTVREYSATKLTKDCCTVGMICRNGRN